MPKKLINVDQETCIGCNTCPLMAPDIFELDKDTFKAKVIRQPQEITPDIQTVIDSCPVAAITVVEK